MAEGTTPLETEIDRVKKEIDELTADVQVRELVAITLPMSSSHLIPSNRS